MPVPIQPQNSNNTRIKKKKKVNSRKKKKCKNKEHLLGSLRVFVDFTRLLLALALEVVEAVSMPLPVQLYVISLRLHKINQSIKLNPS
jgi:hypothetical protein